MTGPQRRSSRLTRANQLESPGNNTTINPPSTNEPDNLVDLTQSTSPTSSPPPTINNPSTTTKNTSPTFKRPTGRKSFPKTASYSNLLKQIAKKKEESAAEASEEPEVQDSPTSPEEVQYSPPSLKEAQDSPISPEGDHYSPISPKEVQDSPTSPKHQQEEEDKVTTSDEEEVHAAIAKAIKSARYPTRRRKTNITVFGSEDEEEEVNEPEHAKNKSQDKEADKSKNNFEDTKQDEEKDITEKSQSDTKVDNKDKEAVEEEQQESENKEGGEIDKDGDSEMYNGRYMMNPYMGMGMGNGMNMGMGMGMGFPNKNNEPFVQMEGDGYGQINDAAQKRARSPGNEGDNAHPVQRPRLDEYPFANAPNANLQMGGQNQPSGGIYRPGGMMNPALMMEPHGYPQGMQNMNAMQPQHQQQAMNAQAPEKRKDPRDHALEAQMSTFHKDEIQRLVNAGEYRAAEDYARGVIASDSIKGDEDCYDAYSALSTALFQMNKFAEAKEVTDSLFKYFDTEIETGRREECFRRMALCCLELGENEEAYQQAKRAFILWKQRLPESRNERESVDLVVRACKKVGRDIECNFYLSLLVKKEEQKENEEPAMEVAQENKVVQQGAFSNAMAMYDNRRYDSASPTPAARGASNRLGTERSGTIADERVQINNDAPGFNRAARTDSPHSDYGGSRRRRDDYSEDYGSRRRDDDRESTYPRQRREDSRDYFENSFPRNRRQSSNLKTHERLDLPLGRPRYPARKPKYRGATPPVIMPYEQDFKMPRRYRIPEVTRLAPDPLTNERQDFNERLMYYVAVGNAKDVDNLLRDTPLHDLGDVRYQILVLAAEFGFPDVAEVLCKHKASMNGVHTRTGLMPLHQCAIFGSGAFAKVVIENHGNYNAKIANGMTPVHLASIYNQPKVLKVLIDAGAAVNLHAGSSGNGNTALHFAVKFGNRGIIPMLLDAKAGIDYKNSFGQTSLHLAAENGDVNIVRCLLANYASPLARDHRGRTPIDLAHDAGIRRLLSDAASNRERRY